jgi:two-component system, NarL family, invasion response regulator UvrY
VDSMLLSTVINKLQTKRTQEGDKLVTIIDLHKTLRPKIETPKTGSHEILSKMEMNVFLRIADGKTVGQIAKEFGISPNTVSTHRTRTLKKMGLTSNLQLINYAVKQNLV